MASTSTHSNAHGASAVRADVKQILEEILARLSPEPEASAPPYPQIRETQSELGDHAEDGLVAPKRLPSEPSERSRNCQGSPSSSSLYVGSPSSTERLSDASISAPDDGGDVWVGQQHLQHNRNGEESRARSTKSEKAIIERFPHGAPDGTRVDGYTDEYPGSVVISGDNTPRSTSMNEPSNHSSEKLEVDVESQTIKAKRRLHKMLHFSSWQKSVIVVSIIVAVLSLITMSLIFRFRRDQKMSRAGFTGGTTVIVCCVAAGMWAGEKTMVETLIAMNVVMVYGIFLNSQIDVFLSYT